MVIARDEELGPDDLRPAGHCPLDLLADGADRERGGFDHDDSPSSSSTLTVLKLVTEGRVSAALSSARDPGGRGAGRLAVPLYRQVELPGLPALLQRLGQRGPDPDPGGLVGGLQLREPGQEVGGVDHLREELEAFRGAEQRRQLERDVDAEQLGRRDVLPERLVAQRRSGSGGSRSHRPACA